ncbi:alpha/beta hydrolase [Actinopolymorpha singaporensis]|uniref:Alpha/beta hydrolase n=1 Tax=Actinopolymorpha singaporensis TaxID=117157 RepID=A0A1H1T5B9_9ACTN|nr:alpha/beta hydrolase [Actinopolymorpha singaporensis]SDS55351.1 Alpha/beta hydrolase [Actinopolymorpha singaporensis]
MRTLLPPLVAATVLLGIAPGGSAVASLDSHTALPPLRYAARTVDGHRFLAYDARGDGRVVEVLGDLASADQVAVLVPGAGHRLADYLTGEDARPTPRGAGRALLAELRRQSPGAESAVVVWLGYDTPEGVDLVSARSERAEAGGRDLTRFVRELGHRVSPDTRITLVGHSYGSVVIGRAAPAVHVDDIVVVGSPGMDAGTLADLHTGARVWAARAPGDPIRFAPPLRVGGFGHGTNPAAPGFGARAFAVGTARGHAGYFTPGTESLANIARIVRGRTDEVTR